METGTPEEVPVVQEAREEDLELLPELVTHLRDRRTELREQWADRITNAHLLSAMTDEEIFSMATSVYDSYVEVLETGSVEALQAYARDLSERISVTAREQLSGASEVCRQARRKRAWARTIQPSRPQRHDALPKRSYGAWVVRPGSGSGSDNFSARWVATRSFATTGSYTFTATADDGMRVYLDGALVIDQWRDQSATTYTASRTVTAGNHEVKVEYYENGGDAVAKVAIAP